MRWEREANCELRCRELIENLNKIGFRTHLGPDGRGFLAMAKRRGGGYYLGASASCFSCRGKDTSQRSGGRDMYVRRARIYFVAQPCTALLRVVGSLVVGAGAMACPAWKTNAVSAL